MSDEPSEPMTEPGVLAVELYREELAHQRRKAWIAIGGVACLVAGAAVMFAGLYFGTDLFKSKPTAAVLTPPPVKSQVPGQAVYNPDKDLPAPGDPKAEPSESLNSQTQDPKTTSSTPPNTERPAPNAQRNVPPLNPFAGGAVPEGWGGRGAINTGVTVKPDEDLDKRDTESGQDRQGDPGFGNPQGAEIGARGVLIVGRSHGGDAEGEASDIVQVLQAIGASVHTANHYSPAGGVIGVQIVATFPASALAQARARLGQQGVLIDVADESTVQRGSHINSSLNTRISDLRKDRAALEEKFLPDAPEIVQIDEEIQNLTVALTAARAANKSQKIVIALIAVGSL